MEGLQSEQRFIYFVARVEGGVSLRKSDKAYGPLHRIMFLNVYDMVFRGIEEINYS